MRLGLGDALAGPTPVGSKPVSRTTRALALAMTAILCFGLGAMMDVSMLVIVLGLFNVAVVAFLLLKKDITWGFLFYLTTSIFFQFGFWIRLPGFPDLYPARIASMLLYLVFMIQILLSLRVVPPIRRIEKAMLLFVGVILMSSIMAGQKPHWVLLLNGYVYPFLFFYFARAVMNREEQVKIVFAYLVFIGLYCGIMGVFEKLQWYELVFPKFIVDPSIRDQGLTRLGARVRGIFLMPAVLGAVMVMGFFPAWLYLQRMRGMIPRVVQLVLLLVTPATIFFTNTRSVYLGFLVATITGAIFSRKLRMLCLGILLAGMVGVFVNWDNLDSEDRNQGGIGDLNTVAYRVNLLYEAGEMFLDHPLFGVGFRRFTLVANEYRRPRDVPFFGHVEIGVNAESVSHNAFITVLVEQGLLGFVPYILIYVFMLQASIRAYRLLPREGLLTRDFAVSVWMGFGAYLANAMFIEVRQFEYMNVLIFFLMGILAGALDRIRLRHPSPAASGAEAAGAVRPELAWRSVPHG